MDLLVPLLILGLAVGMPVAVVFLAARVNRLTRRVESAEARIRLLRADTAAPAHVPAQSLQAPAQPLQAPPAGEQPSANEEVEEPPPLPRMPPPGVVVERVKRVERVSPAPSGDRGGPPKSFRPSDIDWERWVGIRGAAVVGGIALILSGFFFVEVAIERGWLGPAARDTLALVVGVIALAAHSPLIKRGYRTLGESIGGSGAVLIYGAAWAASRLHGLVPEWLALLVMAATTGAALLFSIRSSAPILASFALVGGFATPLLLNTFEQGAATLFGYVLVLDVALLAIARIRRWIWMLPLAALGTTVIQVTWVVVQGRTFDPWVSTLVLGGFALAFTASRATAWGDTGNRGLVHLTLLLAVFAPFAMTSMQATMPGAGHSLWSHAVLLGVLVSCAAVASRRFASPADTVLAAVVAALSLGLAAAQLRLDHFRSGEGPELDDAWMQWSVSAVLLAALHLGLGRFGSPRSASFAFALLSLLLAHAMTAVGDASQVPRSFALTIAALSAIGVASCTIAKKRHLYGALVGAAAGFALMLHADVVYSGSLPYGSPLTAAIPALVAMALGFARLWPRGGLQNGGAMVTAARGFAAFIVVPPLLVLSERTGDPSALTHTAILITVGVVSAVSLQRTSRWAVAAFFAQCGAAAAVLMTWFDRAGLHSLEGNGNVLALATVLTCIVAPIGLVLARRLEGRMAEAAAWAVILPAATLTFGPAHQVEVALGASWGFHALLLTTAVVTFASGWALDRRAGSRHGAGVLLAAGTALAGVSLSRYGAAQWTVTATAITGGSFAFFCGRARSTGPAGLGAALVTATAAVLIVLTFVEGAFLTEPLYIPLQVTIDHGLVAASLVAAAIGLRRLPVTEGARKPLFVAVVVALLAILFAWVNAVVLNHFATGDRIRMEFGRMQARDLTLSLSWAVFGGTLLGVGLARRITGLRWASLAVLIATVLKVFLYDLGALTGLSRVGSFLGLAVCLLGVSMLYARVLGRDFERPGGGGDTLPPHDDDAPESDQEPTPDKGGVAPPGRE